MEEQLQQVDQAEAIQPEVKERNRFSLFILAGVVVAVTLAFLTLGYFYLQDSKEEAAPPVKTNSAAEEEESKATEDVVVEDEQDLGKLYNEVESSNTDDFEKDYQQALSESSGL